MDPNGVVTIFKDNIIEALSEDDEDVEVYNLNGFKVTESVKNLQPGIYIVHKGAKVKKIAVK